jgi:hypothetical protein
MNLARRSFGRRSLNMEMMKMVVWYEAEHVPTTSTTVEDGPSPNLQ